MSLSRRERIWPTRKSLAKLDGAALASIGAVRSLLNEKRVRPAELQGQVAWGQYLDEPHRSTEQWGRFGTSTAVVALAVIHGCEDGAPNSESIFDSYPLDELAPILPESWPPPAAAGNIATLKDEDFLRAMKLAYIIDALKADTAIVPSAEQPQLVDHLLGMALPNMPGWSTRPPGSPDRERDRHLVTTYILWALRRFPQAQKHDAAQRAYFWIAEQVIGSSPYLGIDLVALACLALQGWGEARNDQRAQKALEAGEKRVVTWARRQKRLAIDRPYFNGFSEGHFTDYVFLTPELLVALFLLRRGNPPRSRRFVLRVISDLTDNIAPPVAEDDRPAITPAAAGYRVQGGMIRTADQPWVVRLLREFHKVKEDGPRPLLPSATGWLTTARGALATALLLIAAFVVISVLDEGWSLKVFSAIALAIATVLIQVGFERKRRE